MSTPDPVEERQAVVDVCIRYALALDTRDWTMLRSCFSEDAVADYEGRDRANGYEQIEATCRRALEPLRVSQHLLGNHLVTVHGEIAESSCYFQAQHVRDGIPGDPTLTVAGRYDDRLVRTPDGWKIAHRRLSVMWTKGNYAVLEG